MAVQLASSSSFPPSWTYDVFLSFRGEDTRFTFTDHLYKALDRNEIDTFIDRHLKRGEEISPAFLKAIEESRISIIVISENYASSRWCLDELVHILECRRSMQQIVWPVFYKVDPSHVRNQTSSFGDAFTGLECKYKDEEKILLWRSVRTFQDILSVANLSGHTVKEEEYEATFIDKIVTEILVEVLQRTYLNVAKYPVGIQSCVQKVKELLGVKGNDPSVVGIWGTSGIGKTTIAKAVHHAIAHKFEGSCFLADVRERSTSREGVIQLQKTLLSKVLCGTELKIDDAHQGISLIKKLLRRKKILLILDDVDELEQLNNLVEVDWFGEGSKVIITTKDRGLLESYGVELIYEVQKLKGGKAIELFSLNAFGRNEPPNNYLDLTQRAIAYAKGLPLALNLIGSHMRNKSIDRWQAILDSYDSYDGEPYRGIQKILRKSYDTFNYALQQVFLDIACFFKGDDKDYVLQILRSSKLNVPSDCIEVLVEKAIITIEYNRILMHGLLEKMGKRIVCEESPIEPGKRSRLWHHKDVYHVLTENRGTKKIKGIVVKWPKPDMIRLNSKSFLEMVNLEIFISCNAHFSGCVDYLPNDLRWIDLDGDISGSNILQKHMVTFNLQYLPRHLVTFNMSYSDIRRLKEFKNLANLTYMNLHGCKFLEKIPNLSGSPNITYLNLDGCTNLVEVDDSIGFLDKLVTLDLTWCSRLTRFAPRLRLRSLESLYLHGCTRLESFPEIEDEMDSLTYLDIGASGIRELPSSIAYLTGLAELLANKCENLIGTSLHHLYGLQHLIQVSFGQCPKLVTFGKNKMKFDEVSSSSIESQLLSNDLEASQDNYNTFALPNLYYLHLEGCNLSESNFLLPLYCWSTLTELDLSRNNFVSLPDCISKFVNLERLYLSGCKRLRETPQALPPKLIELYLNDCTSFEKISKLPLELHVLHLLNCFRLCGHGVAKLENNLLNEESLRRSKLEVIYPGNKVPKWFNYTSNHPTTIQRLPAPIEHEGMAEHVVGGSSFKIPLNLQVGETLLGLVLSIVFEPPNFNFLYYYIIINGTKGSTHYGWHFTNLEAAHVWLKLVDLKKKQGDICNVEFLFHKGAFIKSCGVHPLLRKQDEWLPLSLGPRSSLGKRPRPLGSSDTVHEDYDRQRQWLSLSSNPADDHPKRRQIDLNVPFDIEEEEEQPSTSDGSQFFLH